MNKLFVIATVTLLVGCLGMPATVTPVSGFDIEGYLGKWYEIARLDHSFERGLEQVTAEYSLRDDGGINVVNRGYSPATGEWKEATGKAYFVNATDEGYLKVSFFGPFYGSYVVFELGEGYEYAFISGPDTDYLWLLARTPEADPAVMERFKQASRHHGFDSDAIIVVQH